MSFSLYIMALAEPFAEADILAAFGTYVSPDTYGGLRVRYDDRNESTILCEFTAERTTDSFSVDRPCRDDRLFVALHRLLSARASFLTYPSEELVCLVTTEASASAVRAKHPDLTDALRLCRTPKSLSESW